MNAKVASASAAREDVAGEAALRTWNAQARAYLDRLAVLAERLQAEAGVVGAALRVDAAAMETFFSDTARSHHLDEERVVVARLLASGEAAHVEAARTIQQDHGWIEENWLELGPKLRAVADGNHWIDPAEFAHEAEVFRELCNGHIALVERMLDAA